MKNLSILITLLLLTSCAGVQQQWIADNCDVDSAYSQGVEHAENGEKHDTSSYSICKVKMRGKIKKSYSKGFSSVKNNPLSLIKDVIGLNRYTCNVSPFVEKYTSSGRNLGKVKQNVREKCLAKHDKMHCTDIKCQKE